MFCKPKWMNTFLLILKTIDLGEWLARNANGTELSPLNLSFRNMLIDSLRGIFTRISAATFKPFTSRLFRVYFLKNLLCWTIFCYTSLKKPNFSFQNPSGNFHFLKEWKNLYLDNHTYRSPMGSCETFAEASSRFTLLCAVGKPTKLPCALICWTASLT